MGLVVKTVNEVVDNVLARFLTAQDTVTDVSAGSILRTLVESICFEIGTSPSEVLGFNLYDQLINIYNCGFIDLAQGVCLDRVVTILGVIRNGAIPSSSTVTFRRNTPAVSDITIPLGSRVSTEGDSDTSAIVFETTAAAIFLTTITNERHTFQLSATPTADDYNIDFDEKHVSSITEVRGVYNSVNVTFTAGTDYTLGTNSNGTNRIEWEIPSATPLVRNPDNGTDFFIDYIPLSKDVTVQATVGGSSTNIGALSINTRVDVPLGIESVINYVSASGGQNIESDENLRIRAKNQLAVLSKATTTALRFAILSVSGVNDVQIDDLPLTSVFKELQGYNTVDALTSLNEFPIDSVSLLEGQKTETQTYTTGFDNALTFSATDILEVATVEATPIVFIENTDYQLISNEIVWIGSTPTSGQSITIKYYAELDEDVDWEINFDRKNIKWLSGTLPDDSTDIRVTYIFKAVGVATALVLANVIPLSQTTRDAIEAQIELTRSAGIQVNITEPTVQTVDVDLDVFLGTGAATDAVDQIKENVENYINSLSLGEDVIQSEIVFQAQSVTGVFDVVVTDPSANISISIDKIARAGIITVTEL